MLAPHSNQMEVLPFQLVSVSPGPRFFHLFQEIPLIKIEGQLLEVWMIQCALEAMGIHPTPLRVEHDSPFSQKDRFAHSQ